VDDPVRCGHNARMDRPSPDSLEASVERARALIDEARHVAVL